MKDLMRAPAQIARKLDSWIFMVETIGLEEARKIPSYHDEPLAGNRKGQRSIRLNKAYRAIYVIKHDGKIKFLSIEEVNKHDY
jgi:proteic killer suppression protein